MSNQNPDPHGATGARHDNGRAGSEPQAYRSSSGIPVDSVYTPQHLQDRGWAFEEAIGSPGEPPYTRGFRPTGYREELWKIELYAGFGSAEEANERYRYLIEQGSTGGVSIALDLPTQIGMDSDHLMAQDEVGEVGVALSSLADVERLFEGIPLDKVGHIFTTANCIGPVAAAWLVALAEKQGLPLDSFVFQIQNDPIKEYIARGTQFLPIEAAVRLATDTIEYARKFAPKWVPISISGSHMKQAGGSCVQEAAFTICNGISYVTACLDKGMRIDDFGSNLELHFCTEMDLFEEVAKYRAIRKVWTELVRDRFGGTTHAAQHFRLHAATSGRPLTAQQPLNNISRITLQALAQILGGCEQTRTASFDEALAIPTEEAATTSIRINQIIAHETGVPLTVDPLGGSYYVESLTAEFEEQIWTYIRKVDEMGGSIEGAKAGYFQQELAEGAHREQQAVESGGSLIVGVNAFTDGNETRYPSFQVDRQAAARQIARLQALRNSRDQPEVDRALATLREVCGSEDNVVPAVIGAVKAYATVGEIADVWREVFSDYRPESLRFSAHGQAGAS